MQEMVFIIHILAVLGVIGLVLVQHGKGADMGAAFGSGASNTMFGSTGTISFFAKVTAVLAVVFFITSVTLGIMVAKQAKQVAASSLVIPADEVSQQNPLPPAPVKETT